MASARIVTIFVICLLILTAFPALAAGGSSGQVPVDFSMRLGGLQVDQVNSKPLATVDSSVAYSFYRTYAIGVDFSYMRPFDQVDGKISQSMDDISVYLTDSELWANHYWDSKISAKLGIIFPTSDDSKTASMNIGGTEALSYRQGFGGHISSTYTLGVTEYSAQFNTAIEDDEQLIYNTRMKVLNKLMLTYDILRWFHISSGGSIRTYNDYSGETFNVYALSLAFNAEVEKYASIDFGASTAMKDANSDDIWNGPAASDRLFGRSGVVFYFGTTIRI